jgi:hypothetical protein
MKPYARLSSQPTDPKVSFEPDDVYWYVYPPLWLTPSVNSVSTGLEPYAVE